MTIPLVDPSIFIWINRYSDDWITSFLCGSVGSLHFESQTFGFGLSLTVIFHNISRPRAFSKLQYYNLYWIKWQTIKTCAYSYINLFCTFCEEWRHISLLLSELNWSKVVSKTMGISMIVHFCGQFPPNNLVLIFIYFNNYPAVACIHVEYHPLCILLRYKFC